MRHRKDMITQRNKKLERNVKRNIIQDLLQATVRYLEVLIGRIKETLVQCEQKVQSIRGLRVMVRFPLHLTIESLDFMSI